MTSTFRLDISVFSSEGAVFPLCSYTYISYLGMTAKLMFFVMCDKPFLVWNECSFRCQTLKAVNRIYQAWFSVLKELFLFVSLDKSKDIEQLGQCQPEHSKQVHFSTYTLHRSRRCDWWMHTRGSPWAGRNFLGIWSCRRAAGRWSPATASLCPRSPPGTGSWPLEGSLHTRIASGGLCTVHGYHLGGHIHLIFHCFPNIAFTITITECTRDYVLYT